MATEIAATSTPSQEVIELAGRIREGLKTGTLTLGQVVNLKEDEVRAVENLAANHERQGHFRDAVRLYGMLLVFEPFQASYWKRMARLQDALSERLVAHTCDELANILDVAA